MSEPIVFKPHVLVKAPIVRESRLIADLTMPARHWSQYDVEPLKRGFVSEREAPMVPDSQLFISRRQAG